MVVTHFKDIVEWVGKAWDKLKGFLGFKKEAKEELEDPINVNINEGEKEEKVTVVPETKELNQNELIKQLTDGQGNLNIPLNLNMNNPEELQKFMQDSGISTEGIDVGLNFDDSSGDYKKIIEQFSQDTTIIPNMDTAEIEKQMAAFTDDMNILGVEGTEELANGLSGTDSLQNLGVSVDSINSTITDNLIKDEQMKTYGSNLIQAFIDGMNSKTAVLRAAVESITNILGDYLAVHSPTRKGALHTNNLWGGNLIQSFIKGMKDKNLQLENNVINVAKTISGIDSSFNDISKNLAVELNISKENIPKNLITEPFHIDVSSVAADIRNKSKDNYNNSFKIPNISNKNITNNHEENTAPIYIIINGGDKEEKEIADKVIKELEKRGYGKKKKSHVDSSLVNSHLRLNGGY